MAGSFQNEIPAARINLKLDVGTGNAKKKTELPLKMLVLGDFSFSQQNERVADRERISVDKNNFTQVMDSMDLNLSYSVDNKLTGDGEMAVKIPLKSMDSFKPENVARTVPELGRLLAARNLLKDLKSNLLDNREFRKRLEEIINDPSATQALQDQLQALISPAPAA